jgi:predicted nucleic acid-binding protein
MFSCTQGLSSGRGQQQSFFSSLLMAISHQALLFFDASCLIAASGSPAGGSAFILAQCRRGGIRAAVSTPVCDEAERNVRAKLPVEATVRYLALLRMPELQVIPEPTVGELARVRGLVEMKDEHVLAAALTVGAEYLITLDKGLEEAIARAGVAIIALAPGEFIRLVLTQHPDYPAMRE